ncbi:MAG: hypothetical protein L6Q76_13550 [Polyangiaceae bacterium]|nr:hypothetical protein [Polyangiaceae bacterium]
MADQPASMVGNENDEKTRAFGAGWSLSEAAVTTPSTPSLPMRMWVRSGPWTRRFSSTTSPRPTTHSSEVTMSSIFP